jgi:hypothetical protein
MPELLLVVIPQDRRRRECRALAAPAASHANLEKCMRRRDRASAPARIVVASDICRLGKVAQPLPEGRTTNTSAG